MPDQLEGEVGRTPEEARIQKLEERMEDMVDIRELRAFIKCQRCPWISRTEDEWHRRRRFADELEELIADG